MSLDERRRPVALYRLEGLDDPAADAFALLFKSASAQNVLRESHSLQPLHRPLPELEGHRFAVNMRAVSELLVPAAGDVGEVSAVLALFAQPGHEERGAVRHRTSVGHSEV